MLSVHLNIDFGFSDKEMYKRKFECVKENLSYNESSIVHFGLQTEWLQNRLMSSRLAIRSRRIETTMKHFRRMESERWNVWRYERFWKDDFDLRDETSERFKCSVEVSTMFLSIGWYEYY